MGLSFNPIPYGGIATLLDMYNWRNLLNSKVVVVVVTCDYRKDVGKHHQIYFLSGILYVGNPHF